MTTTEQPTRPVPPPLEWRCPDCSVCGNETKCVEAGCFECRSCAITWTSDGEGEWDEPDEERCAETVQPWLDNTWIKDDDERKHKEFRCVLAAGHDEDEDNLTPHANPEMGSVYARGWV